MENTVVENNDLKISEMVANLSNNLNESTLISESIQGEAIDKRIRKFPLSKLVYFWYSNGKPLNLRDASSFSETSGLVEDGVSGQRISKKIKEVGSGFFNRLCNNMISDVMDLCKDKSERVIIDSTSVLVSKHLKEEYPSSKKNVGGVKIHTAFDIKTNCIKGFELTDSKTNDSISKMGEMDWVDTGQIVIMDRGYYKHERFACLDKEGKKFVIRVKKNVKYSGKKIEDYISENADGFDKDVKLNNGLEVRLVGVTIDGQIRCFVTNIRDTEPKEISDIYKQRWLIEIFFRVIKQVIGLNKINAKSKEYLETQIYCAIMYYLIVMKVILSAAEDSNKESSEFSFTRCYTTLKTVLYIFIVFNKSIPDIHQLCDITRSLILQNISYYILPNKGGLS